MRKIILFLFPVFFLPPQIFSQYWQQQVNYVIDVALDDKEHTLDAFEKIEYINNSPDTLHFIWFHLWPNAYKNDQTAYTDHALENGSTKFYFSDKEERGYINRLDFKVNNITTTTEDHPQYIDIVKLVLPAPLAPGDKITITTPFHVKLPFNFSRGGHEGQSYQVTQWYPKPAVYDSKGWHPMPYLDQGEFYSEFGNFDVTITLPKNYVVAATGELQDQQEFDWLNTRKNYSWEPIKERVKNKTGQLHTKMQLYPPSSSETKTIKYLQNNVHDFAWFADKRFIVDHDTCLLASGKVIDVYSYYTPSQKKYWANTVRFIKDAVLTRSMWIGEYPFKVVSAVQGPESFGGGMEYPTITVISPTASEKILDITIAHEVGHNWFYGILGTNERRYPWMDEGLNTYYDNRYSDWKYGKKGEAALGKENISIKNVERIIFETNAAIKKDQPINLSSDKYSALNYELVAYYKTGAWMEMLEEKLGRPVLDKIMQEYYRQWQFKHPQPEDLRKIMEETSGQDLGKEYSMLDARGVLPTMQRKGWKTAMPFSLKSVAAYIRNPSKDLLVFSPAVGINAYDKFMIGAALSNYKLPPSRFQFLLAPLYATGSKQLNGISKLNYSFYPGGYFRKIDLFLNASQFSNNEFTADNGEKTLLGFQKLVPGIRFTLDEKNPRSNLSRYIQWKTYFINEESYTISYDSTFTSTDTLITQNVNVVDNNRTLHQLKLVFENYRALYPWSAEFKVEHGKDFFRTAFTGNYFFNYPKGGGLDVRLFAGKFFYIGNKTFTKQFATDRYHLNMTGPNGYEDYTYSDYFIGRNKFDKLPSQQIMMRDGGFKVRTDLYSDKVGKSDDWLAAINLNSTIPASINPLSILPVKIPLKVFVDIGTYADAWKRNSELDRFIFDAGLQVSLLKNTVNIYMPLVYSGIYRDYIQSILEKQGRFFKKISFSIDISNFNLKKMDRNIDF